MRNTSMQRSKAWLVGGRVRVRESRALHAVALVTAALASNGCNAFDEATPSGPRTVRVIPTDERPVQDTASPVPVSGGTLLSLGQTSSFAVSDPARDQISVTGTDPNGTATIVTLPLAKGAEPGRMVMTSATSFAAVLRGSGEVLAVNVSNAAKQAETTTQWQTKVCNAPRGLDFELASNQVHVACAEGTLVSLDAATGEVLARVELEPDLRDVVAKDGRLYVSRFRSAEILFVEQGAIAKRVQLPTVNVIDQSSGKVRAMQPAVAWRMQSSPAGGVAVVHQRATLDEVPIDEEDVADESGGFGASSSPYGGAVGGCGGIVQVAVTQVEPDGARRTTGSLAGVTLPVDFAFSPDGTSFAIADAGTGDAESPKPTTRTLLDGQESASSDPGFDDNAGVRIFSSAELLQVDLPAEGRDLPSVTCAGNLGQQTLIRDPVTAVAFDGNTLMAQDQRLNALLSSTGESAVQQLVGEPSINTGHELFHRNSGGGLACASCHPEGTSDGHVWTFRGLGPRRTQDLAIPLGETEPFHWDGELQNVGAVMDEVFVERMGGVFESDQRLEVLGTWLSVAPKPVRSTLEISASAERGKTLFESKETGCASCHSGKAFTDNHDYFVGTSVNEIALQVPSLVGIAARPPFMHDGCAKTLLERFDPECGGGDLHGKTSQLSSSELDDIVAFLRTL